MRESEFLPVMGRHRILSKPLRGYVIKGLAEGEAPWAGMGRGTFLKEGVEWVRRGREGVDGRAEGKVLCL